MSKTGLFLVTVTTILFSFLYAASLLLPAQAASNPYEAEDPETVHRATALLHTTGEAPEVNFRRWRLKVTGEKVGNPLRLTYADLAGMEQVSRNATLICTGAFTDNADWEGVPLAAVLEACEVQEDYEKITVYALDGYAAFFTRDEVETHFIILALKVNGVNLPPEHGFPLRIVAEDIPGGRWVKWIDYLQID
jgi:DMSO/TMAO reductase YedYZ molybdopterin-dependent catalytic subunit